MSRSLISRSPDLKRLRDEGYEVEVRSNYLLVHSVPYVTPRGEVAFGTVCSELALASPERTAPPSTHVAHFIGEYPHNADGSKITAIEHAKGPFNWAEGLAPNYSFSNKPRSGAFNDYYEKMTSYIAVIWHQARAKDPSVDPRTFKLVEPIDQSSVFLYEDTASSRAGIQPIAQRLANHRVAIVGLGGTGSYVLDLVAKTHVREIHLYDGDRFRQHNAFRSPGAAPREALERQTSKAAYFADLYSQQRHGIVPHEVLVDEGNVAELHAFNFVFLCVDNAAARRLLISHLQASSTAFIDVGMDIHVTDGPGQLWGTCRVTTSTPTMRDHVGARVSMGERPGEDLYASNIQVADLNAMNAVMAVIRWKRLVGYYFDDCGDHDSIFTTSLNKIVNSETVV